MKAGRLLLTALLLLLVGSCKHAGAVSHHVSFTPQRATTATAVGGQSQYRTLLGSHTATLSALRTEQGHRPVSVLVPGAARPAPVQARTTDPVSGGLDLPSNASSVAWWASGAQPTDPTGTVVLAAHVIYQGRSGPFTKLARLVPGALIIVTSADGGRHNYRIVSSRLAPKAALDRAILFSTSGPATLALVTCGGAYDQVTHSFVDNLVVLGHPV